MAVRSSSSVLAQFARAVRPSALTVLLALGLLCAQVTIAAALPVGGETAALPEPESNDARHIAAWVIETNDNHGLPFIIVDKLNAEALAFDAQGVLLRAAPVLLGVARGDDSPADIGTRALASIGPEMRVTPTGRFMAARGTNLAGHDILWVDYDAGLSLHPVVTGMPADRRRERLATPTTLDNRISYGCINVPPEFYESVVRPLFEDTVGVVYILPETRSIEAVFFADASH